MWYVYAYVFVYCIYILYMYIIAYIESFNVRKLSIHHCQLGITKGYEGYRLLW